MKYHAPSICPVCGNNMDITRVHCSKCNTELTGKFTPCKFCTLEEKHMVFVETFLRCRGSIKEMEKALGVSYPTVRNMMDAALEALGMGEQPEPSREEAGREAILNRLAGNEIDVNQAVEALRNLKGETHE